MRKNTGPSLLIRGMALISILLFAGSTMFSSNIFARANRTTPETSQMNLPAITDAWISEGYSTATCGNELYLAAGYDRGSGQRGRVRSFLKFDLTSIPEGTTISQAILYLYFSDFHGPLLGTFPISIAKVSGPWAENSVQWSTSPTVTMDLPITTTVNHASPKTWVSLDITALAQGWVQGQYPNYGVALLGSEEISLNSVVEFFDSSESSHPPRLEVTYQVPSNLTYLSGEPQPLNIFLPLLLNKYPPALDLHPIDNDGGEGSYTISWTPLPSGTWTYELYEWTGNAWQVIFSTSSGATSFIVDNKPPGTYSYMLKATGEGVSEQSVVRSVTVSDLPNPYIYLIIGVGDYQNMPSVFTQDDHLGNDLKYPLYDAIDIQDMLEVYGNVDGLPSERILALKNHQATKTAIRAAIVDWLDARESPNTTIFIYYAGHTLLSGEPPQPYLAPYDLACEPCDQPTTWLPSTGISATEINSWLGELASEKIMLVLDSAESVRWIGELGGSGRQILAGSSNGQKRWEFDDIKNGAFSWFFNNAYIQPGNGSSISLQEAFNYTKGVNSFVEYHTSNIPGGPFHQNPVFSGLSFPGDYVRAASIAACNLLK